MTPAAGDTALVGLDEGFAGESILPGDPADDERGRLWARDVCDDVKPWATWGTCLDGIGDDGEERMIAGLGAENVARLSAVQAQSDPGDVFRLDHDIAPRARTEV